MRNLHLLPYLKFVAWIAIIALTVARSVETYIDHWRYFETHRFWVAADFTVFWTAARIDDIYDFAAITAAQKWITGDVGLRPFAYPPSFLLWIEPFAWVPPIPAYIAWISGSLALFVVACRRVIATIPLVFGLAAHASAMVILSGQVTFLVAALITGGLHLLRTRPALAGVLFSLAATIKPQSAALIPLALLAAGEWRALKAALLSGLAVGLSAMAVQGPDIWRAWLESIPKFSAVVREIGIAQIGVTPTSTTLALGLEGWRAGAVIAWGAAIGVGAVWVVFRRSDNVVHRMLALVCGTLLVLPYALKYELAAICPFAAVMLLDRRGHPLAWVSAFMLLTYPGGVLAIAAFALVLLWLHKSPPAQGRGASRACLRR